MPDTATKLVMENISVNLADQDEYPATMNIHGRVVSCLADLWNAPKETDPETGKRRGAMGTATTGSSEAIMLGGLAMKRRWQEKMKAAGKDHKTPGPNIVFGSNAQVAIEKFARYFDVEERLVPISKESHYCFDPKKAIKLVDENTIGVIVILGSTYTGHFEPVKEMSDLLDEHEKKTGMDIPIHVDGASGGFVAPFVYPDVSALLESIDTQTDYNPLNSDSSSGTSACRESSPSTSLVTSTEWPTSESAGAYGAPPALSSIRSI